MDEALPLSLGTMFCGERIGNVLEWAEERGMRWSVSSVTPRGVALVGPSIVGPSKRERRNATHRTRLEPPRAKRAAQPPGS